MFPVCSPILLTDGVHQSSSVFTEHLLHAGCVRCRPHPDSGFLRGTRVSERLVLRVVREGASVPASLLHKESLYRRDAGRLPLAFLPEDPVGC